jgi:hypothetical protein
MQVVKRLKLIQTYSAGTTRRLTKEQIALQLLLPGFAFNAHWIQLFPHMMRLLEQGRDISFKRGEAIFLLLLLIISYHNNATYRKRSIHVSYTHSDAAYKSCAALIKRLGV